MRAQYHESLFDIVHFLRIVDARREQALEPSQRVLVHGVDVGEGCWFIQNDIMLRKIINLRK